MMIVMNFKTFLKENLLSFVLMGITAILITVTGILFHQSVIRILPLYISLFIGLLQSRANRFAPLLGGFNSILYMIVYLYLGLYASAGYALLFSCPVQLLTFVNWSRNRYQDSTQFRSLTWRQRTYIGVGFTAAVAVLCLILHTAGSDYSILDSLSSLLGILISLLTMFSFIEYSWLMLPSGIISICLNLAVMAAHPEQITYVIFSFYSLICVTLGFFRVRKLYAEQQTVKNMENSERSKST
ncbi:MAG: nicotinamide mononucleotide transporter [Clostridia bacterium]|nr:nicotinamide mononucleotide transporter [Clostridia bacterium]